MNIVRFVKFCMALVFSLWLLAACSPSPEKLFTKSIVQSSTDGVITQQEMNILEDQLSMAIKKKPVGIKIGMNVIKNRDDMVSYLKDVKHCTEIFGDKPRREVAFGKMHVILETSESLKGYFGAGNADFLAPVIALYHSGSKQTEYHSWYAQASSSANDPVKLKEVKNDEFQSNISNGRFISSSGSPLDQIISASVKLIAPEDSVPVNEVFAFITDGLLSGTNAEIAKDREFTRKNLPLLEDRIRQALQRAAEDEMACLVYRLETEFDGTYFDYQNGKHSLRSSRPYFIVLVGDPVNLRIVETNLDRESNFTGKSPMRFATYDVENLSTVGSATISSMSGQLGRAAGTMVEYEYKKAVEGIPVVFGLQLQLKALPKYFLDDKKLRENMVLTYRDQASGTDVVIPNGDWIGDMKLDAQTAVCNITVSLAPEYLSRMSLNTPLHLRLAGQRDQWYRELSMDDDREIASGETRTFALDSFMGGIMKAFETSDSEPLPDFIDVKFNIKKN